MNPNLLILKKGYLNFFSKRKTTRENFKLGIHSTYILILFFIGFLGIYYVWTLNANATKGYEMRALENQKAKLLLEKELLEIKITTLESIQNISKWEGIKNMEKIEKKDFIVVKNLKDYVFKY